LQIAIRCDRFGL